MVNSVPFNFYHKVTSLDHLGEHCKTDRDTQALPNFQEKQLDIIINVILFLSTEQQIYTKLLYRFISNSFSIHSATISFTIINSDSSMNLLENASVT